MRILFFMARPGHVRNYESTLRVLAERGHTVHLAFSSSRPKRNEPSDLAQAETLSRECPAITYDDAPWRSPSDGWTGIAGQIRLWGDFARFLHPRYRDAPLLRKRAASRLERGIARNLPGLVSRPVLALVRSLSRRESRMLSAVIGTFCRCAERAVPTSKHISEYLRDRRPDVVLVTPGVEIGSAQAEYFKAARALGVPSALCVASWDNLTNKGVLRLDPERVFVWNDVQRREAVELHHVPFERVVLTGAPRFDDWFTRTPSRSSRELRETVRLDPERPYLLYLCSSPFIAPDEVTFVRNWLRALRSSEDVALATAGVLVRPHPQNAAQWRDVTLGAFGNAAIWPREGAQVTDDRSKADFFDSIAHSAGVVGINTTALIEAAILGKTVLTVTAEKFSGTQQGTLHYHYLREANGGFLHEAPSIDENLAQLRTVLSGSAESLERTSRFVRDFVRPFGLDVAATPLLASAIEELAGTPLGSRRPSLAAGALRVSFSAVAGSARLRARVRARTGKPPLRARLAGAVARIGPVGRAGRRVIETLESRSPGALSAYGGREPADAVRVAERRTRGLFAHSSGQLVVGPWAGDAATEALYWIPCLRWMLHHQGCMPEQLVVVSHNGVPAWYDGLAQSVLESRADIDAGTDCPLGAMVQGLLEEGVPVSAIVKRAEYAPLPAPRSEITSRLHPGYVVLAVEVGDVAGDRGDGVRRLLPPGLGMRAPAVVLRSRAESAQRWRLEAASGETLVDVLDPCQLSAMVASARAVLGPPRSAAVTLSTCHGVRTIAVSSGLSIADWERVELLTRVARRLGSSFTLLDARQAHLLVTATSPRREVTRVRTAHGRTGGT